MADKKIPKALYGPSTMEVALGAILGLAAGLLCACVYLVFKPVSQVKEMPKEPTRGIVYYLPGMENGTKGRTYTAKVKTFVGGGSVEVNEEELNAWSAVAFDSAGSAKAAPGAKAEAPKPEPSESSNAGIFNPARPNFKIKDGSMQIGFKCVLNWYGLTKEVIVLSTGTIEPAGDDFVFVPKTLYLGSCPVHLIPGAAQPLLGHLISRKKVPDDINSAWAKATGATLEGSTLKITM